MMYFFTIGFIAIGIYYIIKGVKLRKNLDSGGEDYAQTRKKSNGYILLGLFFIVLAIYRYYTRVVLWGW